MNVTIKPEDAEMIENMILYYEHHGIKNMIENHPHFVIEDFTKILKALENIIK